MQGETAGLDHLGSGRDKARRQHRDQHVDFGESSGYLPAGALDQRYHLIA